MQQHRPQKQEKGMRVLSLVVTAFLGGSKIFPCSGDHRVVLDAASRVGRMAASTGDNVSPSWPSKLRMRS